MFTVLGDIFRILKAQKEAFVLNVRCLESLVLDAESSGAPH